jgi:PTS system mannose-specific IIA component
MIGILVISHGALGDALIQAASHVLGARPRRLRHLAVGASDDPDARAARGRALIAELEEGGVARRLIEPGRVEAVAGASLPMLVRALTYCSSPLAVVVDKALSGGRDGLLHMSAETGHG